MKRRENHGTRLLTATEAIRRALTRVLQRGTASGLHPDVHAALSAVLTSYLHLITFGTPTRISGVEVAGWSVQSILRICRLIDEALAAPVEDDSAASRAHRRNLGARAGGGETLWADQNLLGRGRRLTVLRL